MARAWQVTAPLRQLLRDDKTFSNTPKFDDPTIEAPDANTCVVRCDPCAVRGCREASTFSMTCRKFRQKSRKHRRACASSFDRCTAGNSSETNRGDEVSPVFIGFYRNLTL